MRKTALGRLAVLSLWAGICFASTPPIVAQADDPSGLVRLGGTCPSAEFCPPGSILSPHVMPSPVSPNGYGYPPNVIPLGPSPYVSQGLTQAPGSAMGQAPSPTTSNQAPASPIPSFFDNTGPVVPSSQQTPLAASRVNNVPSMNGDFFGSVSTAPSILPGAIVDQAIFLQPSMSTTSTVTYFRSLTPLGGTIFDTDTEIYVPTDSTGQPTSANNPIFSSSSPSAAQLLQEFDGTLFTGDIADLGLLINAGPFMAVNSGTVGTVNLLAPETTSTLLDEPIFNIHGAVQVFVPSPGAGGTVGRQKISENRNVLPKDRVYVNYSGFSQVPIGIGRNTVHRIVPGVEKTFFNGNTSLETRFPFASTVDSTISTVGATNDDEVEFGNVTVTLKQLLYRTETLAVSIGTTLAMPTASDVRVVGAPGLTWLQIQNQALHVLPFIGAAFAPDDRFFSQAFLQADIGANGNPVHMLQQRRVFSERDSRQSELRSELVRMGDLDDTPFLFASTSMGYWLYKQSPVINRVRSGNTDYTYYEQTGPTKITGFAPIIEFHLNQALDGGNAVRSGPLLISNTENVSVTNMVLGATTTFGRGGSLTAAWSTPVIGLDDKQFNNEVRLWLAFEN